MLRKRCGVFCVLVLLLLVPAVHASAGGADVSQDYSRNLSPEEFAQQRIATANATVNVFYSRYCGTCHKVLPFIEEVSRQYPGVEVHYYDVYNSSENLTLFYEFGIRYNMHYASYPVLFAGESVVLEGSSPINEHTEEVFRSLDSGLIPDREYEKRWISEPYPGNGSTPPGPDPGINAFLVAAAGLIDGINPCAFAVLVFLLVSFTASRSRREMLFSGLAYVSAVFLFYILAGLGIMRFIEAAGLTYYFSMFAGIVAVIAGSISILNAFSDKFPVSLSIPRSSKGLMDTLMKKASIPAAFLLGIAVGVFELPCTGGIYLAILSLLSSEMTFYEGVPFLVLYNAFFVLPLLLITVAVYSGLSPAVVNEFRENHRRNLKLILGAALILIGVFVIWWQM
ncbi:GAP family protein [uncultured Methanoculleus sp.]|mgnify:FL=1|jgi:cytochrome c biogenesis protein CcdA